MKNQTKLNNILKDQTDRKQVVQQKNQIQNQTGGINLVNQKHLNDGQENRKERTSSMTGIMVPKVIVKPFDNELDIINQDKEIPQKISMNEKIRLAKELKA